MLSRIADALFWLNRYMERTEGLLRATSTHYNLSLDKGINANLTWRPMLEAFTNCDQVEIGQLENDTDASLRKLLIDTNNSNSLKSLITKARENARGVQDHITKEMWEEVNQMYHLVNQPSLPHHLNGREAPEIIDSFTRRNIMYTGVTDITMSRGLGWSFMNLGKYVERCMETILLTNQQFRIIDYNLNDTRDIMQWRYLLMSLSGYELHLKTYQSANYNQNVLRQVLFNETFTRSLIYSLSRIDKDLKVVAQGNNSPANVSLLSYFGRLNSKVQFMDFDSLNDGTLRQFLAELQQDLLQFNKRLGQLYFSYS